MKTIRIKLGSSLGVTGVLKLPQGTWVATAAIARPNGALIGPLSVTLMQVLDPVGQETHTIGISADAETTASWPVGNLQCDIRFEDVDGNVIHSPTIIIATESSITNAA